MVQCTYESAYDYDMKYSNDMQGYDLIVEWAKRLQGTILDLGCGTGRLAIPLAMQGFDVEGVDISESMLKLARSKTEERNLDIPFYVMNVTELNVHKPYAMMFMAGNTFQHLLTNLEQDQLLRTVHEHLQKDGIFIFGLRMPNLEELGSIQNYEERYRNALNQVVVEEYEEIYNPMTQVLSFHIVKNIYGRGNHPEQTEELRQIRYTFPLELERLLQEHAFRIEHRYGSWNKGEVTEESRELIYVCRKS
ncbi:class I SAM-dependent DNA methyltransferase [Paenibacillus guangzhouensis]|uniref:class I SAM-dependent DNA methyltransferase n=1 Tax=Paenibacillus guangzhouensis TaxID=1473112 RepID=UPI0012669E9D|nr:class I SAM-dependent methyltransferase [Paenibacillus guangzhouensis]